MRHATITVQRGVPSGQMEAKEMPSFSIGILVATTDGGTNWQAGDAIMKGCVGDHPYNYRTRSKDDRPGNIVRELSAGEQVIFEGTE